MAVEIREEEGSFRGKGGLELYYRCWLPEQAPKAVLVVLHGMLEHCGRYAGLAERFVREGYAVYGYDQRGHGRSDGARCYANDFSEFTEDLAEFMDLLAGRHPAKQIFILGHSMGATVAAAYAVEHPERLAGLVVSGINIKAGPTVSPFLISIAGILSKIFPTLPTTKLDASGISRDQSVVTGYLSDPLVYLGGIPTRFGAELIKAMKSLPGEVPRLRLPLLILHGGEDRLSDPESSRIMFENAGSKDKTLKIYEGFYHEIFNEPEKEQVLDDISAWLSSHLK